MIPPRISVAIVNAIILKSSNILRSKYCTMVEISVSEIIIEKLLEQRDYYLNTLKHLLFQQEMDFTKKEQEEIKKLQNSAIEQLKKVEQELAFLANNKE